MPLLRPLPLVASAMLVFSRCSAGDEAAPLAPRLASEWREIAGNPELGPLTTPGQQPVDFAVWQAADGAWQLWSCIRHTKEAGQTRLFHRWEGASPVEGPWRPMGVAMRADARFGETPGGLQAPFVIPTADGFRMFYGDWRNICSQRGTDGKVFERVLQPDGRPALFDEGDANARDPMLLRAGDEWICYYTANPNGQGAIFARKSRDLVRWSERIFIAPAGDGGWDNRYAAECPFVVEVRPRCYVLFQTQKYGHNPQTSVYWSSDPLDFDWQKGKARFLGTLPVAAPEIVRQGDRWFIFALKLDTQGIRCAALDWEPVAVGGP